MYKLGNSMPGTTTNYVVRLSDNACIPFDTDNIDYREYLKWLEEGNTPLSAEGTE